MESQEQESEGETRKKKMKSEKKQFSFFSFLNTACPHTKKVFTLIFFSEKNKQKAREGAKIL